jgi:multisubunit Na+/H+ antiporter MnhC subunit
MKPFTAIAIGIFSLICLVHIVRLIVGLDITISGWVVPPWVSVPGAIVTGGLAYMLWKEMH